MMEVNKSKTFYVTDLVDSTTDKINDFTKYRWMLYGFNFILTDILNMRYESKQNYGFVSYQKPSYRSVKYSALYNPSFYEILDLMSTMMDCEKTKILQLIKYKIANDGSKNNLWNEAVSSILKQHDMNSDVGLLNIVGETVLNPSSEKNRLINSITTSFDIMMQIYSEWERLPISAVIILKYTIEFALRLIESRAYIDDLDEKENDLILKNYHMQDLYKYVSVNLIDFHNFNTNMSYFKKRLLKGWIRKYGIDPSLSLDADVEDVGYFSLLSHCRGIKKYLKRHKILKKRKTV